MSTPHPALELAVARSHEHAWCTESSHATSEGRVVYVRCAACGARRVDLQPALVTPPAAVSRVTR